MRTLRKSAAIVAFVAAGAYGQLATTTALVGNVTDTTGDAVPGARVSAVNTGTRYTYTVLTNEQGY